MQYIFNCIIFKTSILNLSNVYSSLISLLKVCVRIQIFYMCTYICLVKFCAVNIKATFSFHKIIPKNAQMTTLYINWSLYITFTMIYYIRQE